MAKEYRGSQKQQYRRKWKNAESEIRQHKFYVEYFGFDAEYANEVIALNETIMEEADAEINQRKPAIDSLRYGYLSDTEAAELVETYIDHIDVDMDGHLAELSFKDEYRRIMNYVF